MKDAVIIACMTVAIICGAIVGIVGGAGTISLVADGLHILVGG